ncbi:anti-sigma factor [uncultured Sphingorhabdus sp.]|uniref:anti-sigma factor n=1 Tax=uncultured Sphingorhabdus sp. TaxID=1686106 RepID=UPI00262AA18F|nr:anti-sigma factor [uncultured Sphingorhabdus sp.]HMS21161.1 anti-sigma factor [Sphingorhabdus sp.]
MRLTDEDIATAGELALGLLDKAEAAQARARLADDPNFASEHAKWSDRMVAMEPLEEEAPSPAVWSRIDAAIASQPRQDNTVTRLRIWQGLTAASFAVALVLATMLWRQPEMQPVPAQPQILVAAIGAEGGRESVAANYNPQTGALQIIPISLDTGTLYPELWIIPEDGVARSLGMIDPSKPAVHSIPQAMRPHLHKGALFAITPEPAGGAPGGKATGPVIAKGAIDTI